MPLFTWVLLVLAAPIGLFFLWYHRHYNVFIRIIITLVFIPHFKTNIIISLCLLCLILFQLLGITYKDLDNLFIRKKETQLTLSNQVKAQDMKDSGKAWDEDQYRKLVRKLFERWGYMEYQPKDLVKGYRFVKHNRMIGVLFFIHETITREAIFRASLLFDRYNIDHLILVTDEPLTLYAEEWIRQLSYFSVWTPDHISHLLQDA